MALMNLLTLGRSLSEARDRPNRYKVMNRALPTFGNPTAPGNRNFELTNGSRAEGEAGQTKATDMNTESVMQKEAQGSQNVFPAGRWTTRVNPFKSEKAPLRPAIQGELSLDRVKPLRNDLNESDLELVPCKPAEPVAAPVSETPEAKTASLLQRVGALFHRKD
jgi:hypothetical protein